MSTVNGGSLDDGWNDPSPKLQPSVSQCHVSLFGGDTVLYHAGEQKMPAVLIAPAEGDCWLARGVRSTHQRIYLDARSITLRLPPNDLCDEASGVR